MQSHFPEREGKVAKNPTQPNICRTSLLRESRSQHVTSVDNVVIGLVVPNALEIETHISLLGQMINRSQIARTAEPSWWLNGLDNLASFLPIQFCAVSCVVTGAVHPALSADSHEICRSVMENSEPSASKSDLGLGIIDTACLFCVIGSDWWAKYKSLLEDLGLKHDIDETREAERYTFGDGGTLVSSIRATAPVFVAGKKGRIVFSVVLSKHLSL